MVVGEIGGVAEAGGEIDVAGADEVVGLEYIGEGLTWWHRMTENSRAKM